MGMSGAPSIKISSILDDLTQLPPTDELVQYYRQRLEILDQDYQEALEKIESIRVAHDETHHLAWELHKRSQEILEMQQAYRDMQKTLFDERKQTLRVMAENDKLKVQELKDRKKIRFLLSLSGAPEEEITYFRDRLDKRLVKIATTSGPNGKKLSAEERKKQEERDLIIMEDEIQGLKLTVASLETQLDEQKKSYEATIQVLNDQQRMIGDQEKIRREHDAQRIETLLDKIRKLRTLCRENTRELLRTKKTFFSHERNLIEERTKMINEVEALHKQLDKEKQRNETAEKVIETRVVKKQDTLVTELRSQIHKMEDELRQAKNRSDEVEKSAQRRIDYLRSRLETVNSNYNSLKRRRDYEIEGFTNDILSLRKQLRNLEKSILKYGPLEDKELVLLNLARLTGERAEKISTQLQNLKAKIHSTEQQVQSLAF